MYKNKTKIILMFLLIMFPLIIFSYSRFENEARVKSHNMQSIGIKNVKAADGDTIPWDVLDGGGGLMCSPNYSIGGSLGQISPGVCTTTTRRVSGGYWAAIDSLPPCQPGYICGDVNGDGRITGADRTYILGYIYFGGGEPMCSPIEACADVNLDGRITAADGTYILSYIYFGGPPPCQPPAATAPLIKEKRMEK